MIFKSKNVSFKIKRTFPDILWIDAAMCVFTVFSLLLVIVLCNVSFISCVLSKAHFEVLIILYIPYSVTRVTVLSVLNLVRRRTLWQEGIWFLNRMTLIFCRKKLQKRFDVTILARLLWYTANSNGREGVMMHELCLWCSLWCLLYISTALLL